MASTFGWVALGRDRMQMAMLSAKKLTYSTTSVTSKYGTTTGFRPLGHGIWAVILDGDALASLHYLKLGAAMPTSPPFTIPDRRGRGMGRPYWPHYTIARGPHPSRQHEDDDRCRATPRAPESHGRRSRYGNHQRRRTSVGRAIRRSGLSLGDFCRNARPTLLASSMVWASFTQVE